MKRLLLFTIGLCLAATLAAGLPTALQVPDSLRVGQPFTLNVQLEAPAEAEITPPALGPVQQFELRAVHHDTPRGKGTTHTYALRLAPFETGELTVPALPFAVNGTTQYTIPQSVTVHSVLQDNATLHDIAAPVPVRPRLWDYLLPLLALALVALLVWRLRKRQHAAQDELTEPADTRPAWQVALEMLSSLRQQGYLERDEMVPWYFGLSMVTRTFLERHTGINAVEMTTGEIVHALPDVPQRQRVVEFLRTADGIKFARRQPPAGEAAQAAEWLEGYLHSIEQSAKEAGHV